MFRLVEALTEEAGLTVNASEEAAKTRKAKQVIERIEIILELWRSWLRIRKEVVIDFQYGRCCEFRNCHVSSKAILCVGVSVFGNAMQDDGV